MAFGHFSLAFSLRPFRNWLFQPINATQYSKPSFSKALQIREVPSYDFICFMKFSSFSDLFRHHTNSFIIYIDIPFIQLKVFFLPSILPPLVRNVYWNFDRFGLFKFDFGVVLYISIHLVQFSNKISIYTSARILGGRSQYGLRAR